MFYRHYFFSELMEIAGNQHVYYFLRVYKNIWHNNAFLDLQALSNKYIGLVSF